MRRILFIAAVGAFAGLVLTPNTSWTQGNGPGPGPGGSVLADPFAPAAPAKGTPSNSVEALFNNAPPNPYANSADKYLRPYEEKPDINKDIQVSKDLGPWMIMLHAYTGAEASIMARQMVYELRASYKLPAYTFNYGAEERRKEHERLRAIVEKQRKYLADNGISSDQPIRVSTMRIEEQVGVLVGGYPNDEAARRALEGIRKLKPPDPGKVQLSVKFVGQGKTTEYGKLEGAEGVYVNPFKRAFIAPNPTTKHERPADWDKPDMALLRKLNASEPYNLLNCKKPFTLVVKDFQTPTSLQQNSESSSFLDILKFGGKSEQREDQAAMRAHYLAEALRKSKLDAYVLHTRYTSIVCVGGYDNLDDPGLRNMRTLLETKVMPQLSPYINPPNQTMPQIHVVPWQIPR